MFFGKRSASSFELSDSERDSQLDKRTDIKKETDELEKILVKKHNDVDTESIELDDENIDDELSCVSDSDISEDVWELDGAKRKVKNSDDVNTDVDSSDDDDQNEDDHSLLSSKSIDSLDDLDDILSFYIDNEDNLDDIVLSDGGDEEEYGEIDLLFLNLK